MGGVRGVGWWVGSLEAWRGVFALFFGGVSRQVWFLLGLGEFHGGAFWRFVASKAPGSSSGADVR